MNNYDVVLSPAAITQLDNLRNYISGQATPVVANRYIDRIVARCRTLGAFPRRGTPRDDLRACMRTIAFERRIVIAYSVEDDTVTILAVAYGGREGFPAA